MNNPSRVEERAMALIDESGIDDLPVPVEELAISLGADVAYEPYDGEISGMLYRTDDHALIGVNSKHGKNRQRFTIAHEIGHLELHKGQPMFIDRFAPRINRRDGASNKEEAEANAFAAELLMPRRFLDREVERVVSKTDGVTPQQLVVDLAKRFQVSAEAMQLRLSKLEILDPYAIAGDASH
jgi:Zn-dependent peptidase ImmA (M78 family)